jgi:hypothetical protein
VSKEYGVARERFIRFVTDEIDDETHRRRGIFQVAIYCQEDNETTKEDAASPVGDVKMVRRGTEETRSVLEVAKDVRGQQRDLLVPLHCPQPYREGSRAVSAGREARYSDGDVDDRPNRAT